MIVNRGPRARLVRFARLDRVSFAADARLDRVRLVRVARLDATLLWRNRTALFTTVGLPLLFVGMLFPMRGQKIQGVDAALLQGTGHLAFFLLFAVFMNLATVFTARREDGTLKRLRGTALGDAEILGGSVLTATVLYLAQVLVLGVVLVAALGGRMPADPLLMLAGLACGVVVFALLAFLVSGITPNAELAQLTVLPVMFACMAGAGVMFPLGELPEIVQNLLRALPLTPVVETVRTGYFGRDFTAHGVPPEVGFGRGWLACLPSFAIMAVWMGFGRWLAERSFRWEPRRS
ncbi:ABC transporter permease [Actinomadura rupiterrae]|uniref:ABC transporter permease n=1 Tax=Actinomadura rupiterrae TaxID=559627 RepID=UPI0020A381E4|nr:ABC transporter permease [Actinomadura rupiterrae]MCP2338346.1 ABC-2 type transport system permease protein [Actinomadura rupiterrae]